MDKNGISDLKSDIASLSGQAPVIVKAKIAYPILNCVKVCR